MLTAWALDDHRAGMIYLAQYLSDQFPDTRVEYLPTNCPYGIP